MEPEASLSWLALTMTPGIAARLSARLLREFGSPEGIFRASLTGLEACNLPASAAQAIFKKQTFWRAQKEVDAIRRVGCRLVNWSEPEYPQSLLQIYDPPVLLYVRGDVTILNAPSLGIVGTRRPTFWSGERSSVNYRLSRIPLRKIFRSATESSRACHWGVVIVEGKRYSGLSDYGASGHGIWAGSFRSAGERDPGSELRAKPVDQTGGKTGDQRGRRD